MTNIETSLEPLRAALIARAEADAAQIRAQAEQEGQAAVAAAREQAAALLVAARREGALSATQLLAAEQRKARRAGRRVVLTAQRAAYEQLREQSREAVRRVLVDPTRRGELVATVRERLGDRVLIRDVPDGGLVAEAADHRRIDATVAALVDAAIAALDVEAMWAL
jgi:hypothetical protein